MIRFRYGLGDNMYQTPLKNVGFVYHDGGRSQYFRGEADDCVVRSIAIVTGQDYKIVYDALAAENKTVTGKRSARNGIVKKVYHPWLLSNGFEWVATMGMGTGCRVHLHPDELPNGRLIVSVSKHLTTMIDGVIYDTHNPQRGGAVGMRNGVGVMQKETRCVYGYYKYEVQKWT